MAGPAAARWYKCVSDVGRERTSNEDSHVEFAFGDGSVLLVVCDGMGGHEAGEVASAIAVETIGRVFGSHADPDPRVRLYDGFVQSSENILAEAARSGKEGMGTTGVAAFIRDDEVYVAYVGDSRLYHLRHGALMFRTKDHTRVQKMVDLGILTEEQAHNHPDANVLVRALGHTNGPAREPPEPDVRKNPLKLEPGDAIMLCSDGLYDLVGDAEIGPTLATRNAQEGAQALVDLANARGGHDNVTVTVLLYGQERGVLPTGRITAVTPVETQVPPQELGGQPSPTSLVEQPPRSAAEPQPSPWAAKPGGSRVGGRMLFFIAAGVVLAAFVGLAVHISRSQRASQTPKANSDSKGLDGGSITKGNAAAVTRPGNGGSGTTIAKATTGGIGATAVTGGTGATGGTGTAGTAMPNDAGSQAEQPHPTAGTPTAPKADAGSGARPATPPSTKKSGKRARSPRAKVNG